MEADVNKYLAELEDIELLHADKVRHFEAMGLEADNDDARSSPVTKGSGDCC